MILNNYDIKELWNRWYKRIKEVEIWGARMNTGCWKGNKKNKKKNDMGRELWGPTHATGSKNPKISYSSSFPHFYSLSSNLSLLRASLSRSPSPLIRSRSLSFSPPVSATTTIPNQKIGWSETPLPNASIVEEILNFGYVNVVHDGQNSPVKFLF